MVWVLIKATLGLQGRKYDSDRRLVTYYNNHYNESNIPTRDIRGMMILPYNTEVEKERVLHIYKHFFPHCVIYELNEILPS